MTVVLLLACFGVTIGPGWSEPFLATDSANTAAPLQFISMDNLGRIHLVWEGFSESQVGYKMFSINGGTELYPETMISRDVNSFYVSTVTLGDSLFAFWREIDPVYSAARSLTDGSEVLPATYLFTTSTQIHHIRSSPDSLGRLHVLYNGGFEGMDVFYAVWSPSPDSGFTTEYEWHIEPAWDGGVLLVDGDRVHVVVQDSVYFDYMYVQYDLEGNTTVPLTDFTQGGDITCSRYPELAVDSEGNLLILDRLDGLGQGIRYGMWKINGETGELMLDCKTIIEQEPPDLWIGTFPIVRALPGNDEFYLAWCKGYDFNKIYFLIFDSFGNIVHDCQVAYDYSDEEPEDTDYIDGVVDEEGNLYIIYRQGETEPYLGTYPTFGWFDYSTLGIEDTVAGISPVPGFTVSRNPVNGSVTVFSTDNSSLELSVFDITGREVSTVIVSDGVGVWNGNDSAGNRLPSGVYNILDHSGFAHQITLLDR